MIIILIKAEKAFDKIQYSVMINILKLGIACQPNKQNLQKYLQLTYI